MGAIIIIVLTFTAGSLGVFAVNLVITDIARRDRKRMNDRLQEQIRKQRKQDLRKTLEHKDLSELAKEAFEESASEQQTYAQKFRNLIEQSGLRLTPQKLQLRMSVSALVVGGLFGLISRSLLAGLVIGFIAGAIPLLYVQFKRNQRLEALRAQLSDVFDLVSRVLQAGQTMSQAMQTVSQEFKPPVSHEFGLCFEQQNLGLAPEFALKDLARRTGLLELKIFVLAVMVHRQTGGNLTELLDKLALIVRERFRIRGMISSLTAEGRMQALILLVLPPFMFVLLLFVNHEYAMKLFDHPELPIGCMISMTLGALWIRKIVNFDF